MHHCFELSPNLAGDLLLQILPNLLITPDGWTCPCPSPPEGWIATDILGQILPEGWVTLDTCFPLGWSVAGGHLVE